MTFLESFQNLDGNLLIGIQQALNADWLTPVMKGITFLGAKGWFVILLCLALAINKKTRRLGLFCCCALALTFVCCNLVVKPIVDRTRPWVMFPGVNPMLPPPGDASFPSGHTANTMGPAFAMWLYTRPAKIGERKDWSVGPEIGCDGVGADRRKLHCFGSWMLVLAVLMGISRLYLGMHYPSDVVCGWLLGMICALIVGFVYKKVGGRHENIKK